MEYSIVYSSQTGNTEMLAYALHDALGADKCTYFGAPEKANTSSSMEFIGFWTDKGTADAATLTYISSLCGKKVFLFGTAGFGGSQAYFEKIIEKVKEHLDKGSSLVGWYMCQGKMPPSVRARYETMKSQPQHPANIDLLIENYDEALSHPDEADITGLIKTALSVGL